MIWAKLTRGLSGEIRVHVCDGDQMILNLSPKEAQGLMADIQNILKDLADKERYGSIDRLPEYDNNLPISDNDVNGMI